MTPAAADKNPYGDIKPYPGGRRFAVQHYLKIVAIVGVTGLVFLLAWKEIHGLRWRDVRAAAEGANSAYLVYALCATLAALAVLGLYDAVAFPGGKKNLSFFRRWLIGMFCFAWSNLLSFGGMAGPAIRFVLYRRLGLNGTELAQGLSVQYFSTAFGLIGWLLAVLCPIPAGIDPLLSFGLRALLALVTSLSVAYVFGHRLAPRLQKLLNKRFPGADLKKSNLPVLGLISFAEWALTFVAFQAVVMAVSPVLKFGSTVTAYFVGILVGFASLLPGGVGAADAVWLHMLHHDIGGGRAAAAVLLYRVVFYLIPWLISAIVAYVVLSRQTSQINNWHRRIVASAVAVGALILLLSGATPAIPERIRWLSQLTPIGVIEVSHLLSVMLAAIMLYLVRGLLRGYRSAMLLTTGLLCASMITHILKGADIEESALAMILVMMLLLSANHFSRRGTLTFGWEILLAVFAGTFCLFLFTGFAAFENVPYREGLWTRIAASADASRFLRSIPVLVLVGLFFAAREAMSPKDKKVYPTAADIDRAEHLIHLYADSAEPLLVGGADKAVWIWAPAGKDRGLVLYQRSADKLVVFKDPVVDSAAARTDLMRDFLEFADELDLSPVFSMISIEWIGVLHDFGYRFIKFTQEAIIDLKHFALEGGNRSGMRHTLRNCEKKGFRFTVLSPPHTGDTVAQCRSVSDEWLRAKGGREMQFSACYFSEPYLQRHPLGVARDEQGNIAAFVNILVTRDGGPATIDFMRYRPGLINNLMDFVIIKTILHCQTIGCTRFSLGGAALSNVGTERYSYFVERLLRMFSIRAEKIYNYQGIYQYKSKFAPEWAPRYVAHRMPFDWGSALYANMLVVRPTRTDKRRIATARVAGIYPYPSKAGVNQNASGLCGSGKQN